MRKIILELLYQNFLKRLKKSILSYEEIEEPVKKEYVKEINQQKIEQLKFQKEILEFEQFLRERIPEEYRSEFYHNINRVNITSFETCKKRTKILPLADYDPLKIIIRYQEKELGEAVYHELFHLSASSIAGNKEKISFYGGLSQIIATEKGKKHIGKLLDEGYTELLALRHFNNKNSIGSYFMEVCFAKCIEDIIGKEKMYQYYFSSNIKGLIDELTQYNSRENILDFLVKEELLSAMLRLPKYFDDSKITKCFHELTCFCLDSYQKKLELAFQKGELTKEEIHYKQLEFAVLWFPADLTIENICKLVKEP